jgi:hypothetical protein
VKKSFIFFLYLSLELSDLILCQLNASGNILETPASSEKRYRAALLKNRFADIILKAREKPLPQVCTYLQFSPSLIALSGHWIMLLARTPVKVVWL